MSDFNVNLPKTAFAMRAELPKNEPKWLDFWNERAVGIKSSEENDLKFVLHDGPPYANGNIHIGHAFNKIVKDILNKSRLIEGYSVDFVPGWDCHGLPIELQVEKKIGRVGDKVTAEQFVQSCKKYATEQIALQRSSFKRLGILADWEKPYVTMDPEFEGLIAQAFTEVLRLGYLVRGYKPVYWCTHCRSALAEAEVEYRNKTSFAIDVRFVVVNPASVSALSALNLDNLTVPIWTTTPWTLPANQAVALNPSEIYVIVGTPNGENLLLAKNLVDSCLVRYQLKREDCQIVAELPGKEFEGLELQHPISGRNVPIILGEHVTSDAGTGTVHTAPAHGVEDYQVGLRYKLPVQTPVTASGTFNGEDPEGALWAGMKIEEAVEPIIAYLERHGKLLAKQQIEHSYPHCWRHKTPLIFRATAQWFISMDWVNPKRGKSLRQEAIESLDKIKWLPATGENSMRRMLEQRPDWCISRQRTYGSPIPLFIHQDTQEIHPQMLELLDKWIVPAIKKEGISYWHQLDAQKFLSEHGATCDGYVKVTDTLDVWFDSGVSHYAVLQQRSSLAFPADLYLEGMDQYRGWFQSSLLTSLMLNQGQPPYRAVLAHGFTVDAQGYKMSKSLGNVIDPQTVVQKYGADILRLWAANSYLYDDVAISQEIIDRTVDSYRLLRNTLRFMLGNLDQFAASKLLTWDALLPLDRFALIKVLELVQSSREQFSNYQYYGVCANLHKMLTSFLSGFYFSVIKDRLYTMPRDSVGRLSAQTTLYYLLQALLALLAPIISFTAEEAWQELRKIDPEFNLPISVFDLRWQRLDEIFAAKLLPGDPTKEEWELLLKCREAVNVVMEEARASGKIGSSLEAKVMLSASGDLKRLFDTWGSELRWLLIVSQIEFFATPEDMESHAAAVQLNDEVSCHILVVPAVGAKCERCWHHLPEVGSDAEHPTLCPRCVTNLWGEGEIRRLG